MSMPNGDSSLPVRRRTAEDPPRDCSDRAPALAIQSRWHPDDFDSNPIVEVSEHHKAGDRAGAHEILMKLLAEDLRCLDAHAHLGNFAFKHLPKLALQHYEMGVAIGALSFGTSFDGFCPGGSSTTVPSSAACMAPASVRGISERRRIAAEVFKNMLRLNSGDHQGSSFNLAAVEARKTRDERKVTSYDAAPRSELVDAVRLPGRDLPSHHRSNKLRRAPSRGLLERNPLRGLHLPLPSRKGIT